MFATVLTTITTIWKPDLIKWDSSVCDFVTSLIFRLTNRCWYQFVGEVMTNILSIKEIIQPVTLGIL